MAASQKRVNIEVTVLRWISELPAELVGSAPDRCDIIESINNFILPLVVELPRLLSNVHKLCKSEAWKAKPEKIKLLFYR